MENTNSNTQEITSQELEQTLQIFGQNIESLVGAVSTAQNDIEEGFDNIDPINHEVLSESNLMNHSLTIDCNVETFAAVTKVEGSSSLEETKQSFREQLVDMHIVANNPIYNYKLYLDSQKSRLVSVGTLVVNDYEDVDEVDENNETTTTTYWQVKILGDKNNPTTLSGSNVSEEINNQVWGENGTLPRLQARLDAAGENSIVNNRYYVASNGIVFEDGTTLSLLVKENNEFVPAGMFIEIYKNTMLQAPKHASRKKKGHEQVAVSPPVTIPVNTPLNPKEPRGVRIIAITTYTTTFINGVGSTVVCVYTTYHLSDGHTFTTKNCSVV